MAAERVHGTTQQVVRGHHEREEKVAMLPTPTERFDVPLWTEAKVHPDHQLQVQRALYSVPTRYIGRTVRVRSDQSVVRIYLGGELIKMHARQAPGKRATDPRIPRKVDPRRSEKCRARCGRGKAEPDSDGR